MQVTIYPSKAAGEIAAPPSKSAAHRLLICSGLAAGESHVRGIALSEDISATIDCLNALGAKCSVCGDTVTVQGVDLCSRTEDAALYCRESGSTLRFFIPLCMLSGVKTVLHGSETLLSRPLDAFAKVAAAQKLPFEAGKDKLTLSGPISAGRYCIPGNISSQFVSGFLFALPLLSGESTLELTKPIVSKPYIDITLSALETFGIKIEKMDAGTYLIEGGQAYKPMDVTVEGDYSNAAALDALNLVGGSVTVTGLFPDSKQGDRVYKDVFAKLQSGYAEVDISDCPDLGPIFFVAAALLHGAKFTGTKRLRIKESDRVATMMEELAACGATLAATEDTVTVEAGGLRAPTAPLNGHNDHRVVMALSVLLSKLGGKIDGAEAVRKSFPDFFTKIQAAGVEIKIEGLDQ